MKNDYNRLIARVLLAVVLALIVAMDVAAGLGRVTGILPVIHGLEAHDTQNDPWEAYKVIVERNMFSRQRGARPERSNRDDGQVRTAPALSPESYYLLKGIVQENGAFIGFLEDTRGGQIIRVRQGDSIARGVIKALSLDSIEYQLDDRTITVTMGRDLEGGRGAVTMTQLYEWSQTSSATPQKAATPAPGESAPPGDEADILKQLMERRQQQLGQ